MQISLNTPFKNKTALNFWFDLVLLVLLILTGISAYMDKQLHQTFGLAMSAAVPLHLWLHWNWVMAMLTRFQKAKPEMRLKVGLDAALLTVYLLLFLSGLIVMLIWAPAVRDFHNWMFFGFAGLVTVHLTLNWKWLHSQAKRRLPHYRRKSRRTSTNPTA